LSCPRPLGPCLGLCARQISRDRELHHSPDADMPLQALQKSRFVWQAPRFCFEPRIMTNSGGNRHMISKESWARDRKYLKGKWGEYVQEKDSGGVTRMVVANVARRQKLSL